MSTTQMAAALFHLQQLDFELDRLTTEKQAIASSLQGNMALQKLRAERDMVQQELQTGLKVQEEAEWALEDLKYRLNSKEQRLYGGTVSNPKELHSLQQEVQRLRFQQDHQEEVVLEAMEKAESLQEVVYRKAEALQQAEEKWSRDNAAMVKRRDELETRQQELQIKRAQMAASIDPSLISRYESLRRTRQGRAVSKVEQNSCQWCRVILTPSELQHVRASTELQACSNCGRILFYER